jgi:hypothetical protein
MEEVKRSSVGPDSFFVEKPRSGDGRDSKPIFTMACRNCCLLEELVKWENNDYKI